MEEIKLDVQVRDQIGSRKVNKIRRDNLLPAVVYGGKKKAPTVIQVDRLKYEDIMRHHAGQNVVFHLNVKENGKKLRDYSAIVREEQHDPVTFKLLHLDFQRISLKEEIEVKVNIDVKGEPVGVKKDGGSVDQTIWELDVVCLPTNIPEKLVVNVENMEIGDSVHVKHLDLPSGVKTNHDPEDIILSVVPPMQEEEEEPAEGEEGEEPEVIGKEGEEKEEGEKEESAEEKGEEPKKEEKKEEKQEKQEKPEDKKE